MKNLFLLLGASSLLLLASAFQVAAPAAPAKAAPSDAEIIRAQKPFYPLDKCVVSGEALGAGAVDAVKDGRLVRTCCNKCVAKVDSAAIKKIDEAVLAAQKVAYPLDTCPVSGEKLGADAVDHVYGSRLVRFCCNKCVASFGKDPKPTLAKLDKAYIEKQKAAYKLATCPVSGEKLGGMGEPVDYLYGTTLVRLCCSSCIKELEKDPVAVLKKVRTAK